MSTKDKKLREKKVLGIIVQTYILRASPISSRYISRRIGLSSATIRNIMADLEDIGLINHPHISAGRIPTDKGYRYYVDSLMHLRKVTEKQARQIELEYHSKIKSLDDILEKTTHVLSEFTDCAGVTLLPKTEQRLFRHINLIPISKNRVLVSLITESGFVRDYIIELEHPLEESLLHKISDFLNRELYNMSLREIRSYLVKRLQVERNSSYELVKTAYEIMKAILVEGLRGKLYFDGASHILSYPEFKDQNKLTNILRFFEEKETLLNILAGDLYEEGIKIRIGSENKVFGLDGLSMITAGFNMRNQATGRLGVIGPTRMNYDKVIPFIDLLANTVTKALST